MDKRYKNPDNDPRGVWKAADFSARTYSESGDYPITLPSGRVVTPPASRAWITNKENYEQLVKDNRIWFGKTGNNVSAQKKFLSEVKQGMTAMTIWKYEEVGHTQDAKKEVKALNPTDPFATPKPEKLLERILLLATNPNELVLDSFLGSGTTAAVAQKMGRRWTGGDGYKFYELAPSLINYDKFDEPVINGEYNADMLAAAVALHEGYAYQPDEDLFWKQAYGTENSYLFVTTRHLTDSYIDSIMDTMKENEFLIIACKSYDDKLEHISKNIVIKKIPQMLLLKCEFEKKDYNLNIINPPVYEDEEVEYE